MKTKTCGQFLNWSVLGLLLALLVMVSPEYALGQPGPPGICVAKVDLYAVHFLDANKGVVVGAKRTLCLTNNGGGSWQPTTLPPLPLTSVFYDVQFVNASQGWVVGSGGTILKTTNGGAAWVTQNSNTTYTLRAVYFVDANIGWAVGDGYTIRKTTNGGTTWVAQSAGNFADPSDIYCINATTCSLVGSSSGGGSPIRTMTNGGTNVLVATVINPISMLGVHFAVNPLTGIAVGSNGAIRRASGLFAWTVESSGTSATLQDVHCVIGPICWAVGNGGTIRKGPGTWGPWVAQNSGTTATLYDVHFINANMGWAVGGGGTIRKTINGGATWTP